MTERVAVVVKGYPRLSETFIAQEIEALERRGLDLAIVSLRHPTDDARHPVHERIRAPVLYLPEYARDEPMRVLRAACRLAGRGGFWRALGRWLATHAPLPGRPLPTRNDARRLAQAWVFAAEIGDDVAWIYAHYLHTPCSVAHFASLISQKPYSVSAHAKDIWTTSDGEKRRKLLAARWCVTCTAHNVDALRAVAPEADIELLYHGLDLTHFPEPRPKEPSADGALRLFCVARCVEKKGLDVLLQALAELPDDLSWRFDHIGGGPLLEPLRRQAEALEIADRVVFHGPAPHARVRAGHEEADLFLLPARIAADGDRDGLPNVLMEAFALGTPVIASDLPGVAELVRNGEDGVLVAPDDAAALTNAIATLGRDPERRARLAAAARARITRDFDSAKGADALAARFRAAGLAP